MVRFLLFFFLTGIDIDVDNFMDVLDSGVHICRLAKLIHEKAQEAVEDGRVSEVSEGMSQRMLLLVQSICEVARLYVSCMTISAGVTISIVNPADRTTGTNFCFS